MSYFDGPVNEEITQSKRSRDFVKGRDDRAEVAAFVNRYLKSCKVPIRLRYGNRFLNYKFVDVISEKLKWSGYIRFSNDGQFFIKVPKEDLKKVDDFIESVADYWILFALRPGGKLKHKYCGPLQVKELVSAYRWHILKSKGNRNRLCINCNPESFRYINPYELPISTLGDDYVIPMSERIRILFNENISSNLAI